MTEPMPTLRAIGQCGCCQGLDLQTPEVLENRPWLSAIAYRVGTHSRFKATMLARLSAADVPALRDLTTRSGGDFTVALLDAWASVADVLTFYQERIANEAYLRTATERRSLLELANLIGYVPRPGVAASAYLAFTLDDTGTVEGNVPIPVMTRVQSVPGPGERPEVFETVEAITGRPQWNAMRPLLFQPHPALTAQTRTITLRGTTTNLSAGDSVLLAFGTGTGNQVVQRVLKVTEDVPTGTTRVDLHEDPPDPPPLIWKTFPFVTWNQAPLVLTTSNVKANVFSGTWQQADLAAYAAVQRWPLHMLELNIRTLAAVQLPPPETGVFALRERASVFGHIAPKYSTLPATVTALAQDWESRTLNQEPGGSTASVDLDTTYPGVVAGSWLVLEDQFRRKVYRVTDYTELGRADFTLSVKVSRVKLDASTDFDKFTLRGTTALARSEKLELAELPILDVVRGNLLVLDQAYLGLTAGRPVVVTGARADLDGVTDSEVKMLAEVRLTAGRTELVFVDSLANEYVRASVTVNANVALATHGETRELALGTGDANIAFQRFDLPESPLTFVSAANPKGATSTLQVRINELLWDEVEFLHDRSPDDRVYLSRTTDDGHTYIQLGDGRTGARAPTGRENVRATYRKGMGAGGLVGEAQLSLLLSKPLGVAEVVNPVAAGDAADPETRDDVRRNAPLPTRALDRIVSLRDYEDFARAFTGVVKALATWTWNGHQRGIFITVAGTGGAAIEENSRTYQNLVAAILAAGDGSAPLRLQTYRPAFFRLTGNVGVDPAYEAERVLAAVEAALRTAFGLDAREFGQPVAKSEVITTIQAVPGVVAVDLDELHRVDATLQDLKKSRLLDRLVANVPRAGTNVTVAAELLLLDPRPVLLGLMTT